MNTALTDHDPSAYAQLGYDYSNYPYIPRLRKSAKKRSRSPRRNFQEQRQFNRQTPSENLVTSAQGTGEAPETYQEETGESEDDDPAVREALNHRGFCEHVPPEVRTPSLAQDYLDGFGAIGPSTPHARRARRRFITGVEDLGTYRVLSSDADWHYSYNNTAEARL